MACFVLTLDYFEGKMFTIQERILVELANVQKNRISGSLFNSK